MDALTDKQDAQKHLVSLGAPTMSLEKFYSKVLAKAHLHAQEALEHLLNNGLVVFNYVNHEPIIVDNQEVLRNINILSASNYTVSRSSVEKSYYNKNKSKYPWIDLNEELVSIQVTLAITKTLVIEDKNNTTLKKERELTAWLRDTWIGEGKMGGTAFFAKLKNYVNKDGSPIIEHYSAGKVAGIRWETSSGTTGNIKKKTILNKVGVFKNYP
jgi:hypothetical protein